MVEVELIRNYFYIPYIVLFHNNNWNYFAYYYINTDCKRNVYFSSNLKYRLGRWLVICWTNIVLVILWINDILKSNKICSKVVEYQFVLFVRCIIFLLIYLYTFHYILMYNWYDIWPEWTPKLLYRFKILFTQRMHLYPT